MNIKDLKICTKLICGMLCVVLLFMFSPSYEMYSMRPLKRIHREGAKRSDNALAINEIGLAVEQSHIIINNAVISRMTKQARQEFYGFRPSAIKDMQTISAFVEEQFRQLDQARRCERFTESFE